MVEEKKENSVSPASEGIENISEAAIEAEKIAKFKKEGKFGAPRRPGFPSRGTGFRPVGGEIMPEYESKLLDLARVVRVTAGGKKLRFRAVVVLGNKKSKVGLGIGKGLDVAQAVEKASRAAKKNLIEVATEQGTIPYPVRAKYGAARILLKPQRKGRGLVAGGTVRVICTLAGIKDISAKILGRTSNKLSNGQATINALKKLKVKVKVKEKETNAATSTSASS